MPFLGQDWRSPGDLWCRTNEGWKKTCNSKEECDDLNKNIAAAASALPEFSRVVNVEIPTFAQGHNNQSPHQPHIQNVRGTTRERKVLLSLSDALLKLDMFGAATDLTRLKYLLKLIEQLLMKLGKLSGTVHKHLFNILEQVLKHALKSENNIKVLKKLLRQAAVAITEGQHSHIGSASLWKKHTNSVNSMTESLQKFQPTERICDDKPTLTDIPEECLWNIMSRLTDHRDLVHLGQADTSLYMMSREPLLWRQLCSFHFTEKQILGSLSPVQSEEDIDWMESYKFCVNRKFKMREVYADELCLCSSCNIIFWKLLKHPCRCPEDEQPVIEAISPEAFVGLFQL